MRGLGIAATCFALVMIPLFNAYADSEVDEASPSGRRGMMMHHSMDPEACQEMMASMRESDEELSRLVDRMKTAGGNEKVELVAAVVEALVAQHLSMRAHMGEMSQTMCGGMMKSK